jgi:hypothetical protein
MATAEAFLALAAFVAAAQTGRPLINDPARVNIGFVCRWQTDCMDRQVAAMNRSLRHVKKHQVPAWKVELCNRNASRRGTRKDWIGFDNCIRNRIFRPPRVATASSKP